MEFRAITWKNFWDVIEINVNESQKEFVLDVSVFLAQSYVNLKEGYKDTSLGIYHNDQLVGFLKIVYVPPNEEVYNFKETAYLIDAFIIDQAYQNNGLGKKALSHCLDYCETEPFGPYDTIKLLCDKDNKAANELYQSFGFKINNFMVKGKRLLSLDH